MNRATVPSIRARRNAVGNPHAIGQARELLGFSPENIRLISAVHEAGHAVVGHTLGMVIERALRILRHRWPTVLRMAYVLAKAGSLAEHEVEPLLLCDPQRRLIALGGYRRWRDGETAERWYRP